MRAPAKPYWANSARAAARITSRSSVVFLTGESYARRTRSFGRVEPWRLREGAGMADAVEVNSAIGRMPRGGPTASWLDRRLQTDLLEYTDRYDIPDEVKQTVISALDRVGERG